MGSDDWIENSRSVFYLPVARAGEELCSSRLVSVAIGVQLTTAGGFTLNAAVRNTIRVLILNNLTRAAGLPTHGTGRAAGA